MMNMFNKPLMHSKKGLAMLMALVNLLCASHSFAGTLKDPTQPPAMLNSESSIESATPTGPVLQSIMIGPQTHAAIINGEKVLLGKKYQTATLIKLNEHEAVLRYPDMSIETLSMDFSVEKKLITPVMDDSKRQHKSQHKFKRQSKLNTKLFEVSEK